MVPVWRPCCGRRDRALTTTGVRDTGWWQGAETHHAGLSLVEVVMAVALTRLVTGSLLELVIPTTALFRVLPEAAAVQQRLRYAFDRMFADLVTAGRGTTEYAPGRLDRFLPPSKPRFSGRSNFIRLSGWEARSRLQSTSDRWPRPTARFGRGSQVVSLGRTCSSGCRCFPFRYRRFAIE